MGNNLIIKTKYGLWVFVLFISLSGIVYAHHITDSTPDAITEMEYRIKLDLNPDDVETRYKFGTVLYRLGKMDEAMEQYQEVLKNSPRHFHSYEGIGLIMMNKQEYEEAVSWFDKAIKIVYFLNNASSRVDKSTVFRDTRNKKNTQTLWNLNGL